MINFDYKTFDYTTLPAGKCSVEIMRELITGDDDSEDTIKNTINKILKKHIFASVTSSVNKQILAIQALEKDTLIPNEAVAIQAPEKDTLISNGVKEVQASDTYNKFASTLYNMIYKLNSKSENLVGRRDSTCSFTSVNSMPRENVERRESVCSIGSADSMEQGSADRRSSVCSIGSVASQDYLLQLTEVVTAELEASFKAQASEAQAATSSMDEPSAAAVTASDPKK